MMIKMKCLVYIFQIIFICIIGIEYSYGHDKIKFLFRFLEENMPNYNYVYEINQNQEIREIDEWINKNTKNTELLKIYDMKTKNVILSSSDDEMLMCKLKFNLKDIE